MLTELRVENFALVEKVQLTFGPGLNLLTGETGAGKSILLDALSMVLGERTSVDVVRHGADKARVEAAFVVAPGDLRVTLALEMTGIEPEDGLLILSRELSASGKSAARINGRPVTIGTLKTLGDALIDIHGQHEHQSLLSVERHAELLDSWCGPETLTLKAAMAEAWETLIGARRELEDLRRDARERARLLDLLTFQRDEIDAADPQPGEDNTLLAERQRLAGAEKLHEASQAAYVALRDGAIDALSTAVSEMEKAARIDAGLSGLLETLHTALYSADDALRETRAYRDGIEFHPERLAEIEERLETLKTLRRKYGATIDEILHFRAEVGERLATLEHAEERLERLEAAVAAATAELMVRAARLTAARKKASEPFARAIQTELADLAMAATRFAVAITPKEPGAGGADALEFLLAPNPGEPLKPLAKIASGGELSRVMLALKSVMARHVAPPTLIFDEIDTGIGGRTGTVLAEKLHTLGQRVQTLCITHLPQIAARGATHFLIEKRVVGKRTSVHVTALEGEARVSELARMLGGATETVLAHAREMLSGQ